MIEAAAVDFVILQAADAVGQGDAVFGAVVAGVGAEAAVVLGSLTFAGAAGSVVALGNADLSDVLVPVVENAAE
jgi:hypothetical protein